MRLMSHKGPVSPIPESSPLSDKVGDSVSAMSQKLSQGLLLLSSNDDFFTETPRQGTDMGVSVRKSAERTQCIEHCKSDTTFEENPNFKFIKILIQVHLSPPRSSPSQRPLVNNS